MRVIRITTDNEVSICHNADGNYTRDELAALIGDGCEYAEIVMPRRLYNDLHIPKIDAVMMVDEDGRIKGKPMNIIGSWLYETDKHDIPIVGNILIVGFMRDSENDICDLKEEQLNFLYEYFKNCALEIKRRKNR